MCTTLFPLSLSLSAPRLPSLDSLSHTRTLSPAPLAHTHKHTRARTHTHSAKAKERLQDKLIDVIRDAGVSIDEHQKYLRFEVCASDEDGEEVDMPSVRFSLKK